MPASSSPSAHTRFCAGLGRNSGIRLPQANLGRQVGACNRAPRPPLSGRVLKEAYPQARNGCDGPTGSGFGLGRVGRGVSP